MGKKITINNRLIGCGMPVYIIAEMSANHGGSLKTAAKVVKAAKAAGADAIKVQTYTPDTITIKSNKKHFRINGTIWNGKILYDLYKEAYMPWGWQPKIQQMAHDNGLDFFSTPFDATSVDFLEQMNVPAYKIASFELVDIPLIEKVARTGKPMILSTGLATLSEIKEALKTFCQNGGKEAALLKCTSEYPAPVEKMNVRTIPHLQSVFRVPVGLSDHSMSPIVPSISVAIGACIIEKHLTLSRASPGPDSTFSLEPNEFKQMVEHVRETERALGEIKFGKPQDSGREFRRSIFVVKNIKKNEILTSENIRVIRPGYGLHSRCFAEMLGSKARNDIESGTPLKKRMVMPLKKSARER